MLCGGRWGSNANLRFHVQKWPLSPGMTAVTVRTTFIGTTALLPPFGCSQRTDVLWP